MNQNRASIYVGIVLAIIVVLLLLVIVGLLVAIYLPDKHSFEEMSLPILESPLTPFDKNIDGAAQVKVPLKNDNSLDAWHLLPHDLVETSHNSNFDYIKSLYSHYPVILYLYGVGGSNVKSIATYNVLRKFFHVIAFDYSSYQESFDFLPDEESTVKDLVQLYKWVKERTDANIYFWGHEIGAALSAHTISKLLEQHFIPMGLFLEAPFTSLRDQIQELTLYKHLRWLPQHESHIFEHFENNGFSLNTTRHLASVKCPIMIVHAKDDPITPYDFSLKLYEDLPAFQKRIGVELHLLPDYYRCGHFEIGNAPPLPQYIKNHIDVCETYWCTVEKDGTDREQLKHANLLSTSCAQYALNLLSED